MHDNKPINWRDHLAVHPAAELFPLLSETDPAALKELAEDIRAARTTRACRLHQR